MISVLYLPNSQYDDDLSILSLLNQEGIDNKKDLEIIINSNLYFSLRSNINLENISFIEEKTNKKTDILNDLFKQSKGEYILISNSSLISSKDRIYTQVKALKENNLDFVGGAIKYLNKVARYDLILKEDIGWHYSFYLNSVMFKKSSFYKCCDSFEGKTPIYNLAKKMFEKNMYLGNVTKIIGEECKRNYAETLGSFNV